jgi:hypothetical protein
MKKSVGLITSNPKEVKSFPKKDRPPFIRVRLTKAALFRQKMPEEKCILTLRIAAPNKRLVNRCIATMEWLCLISRFVD